MLEDKNLSMQLLRAGDHSTWERVFHAFSKPVFLFVHSKLKDTALAEDVVTESMMKLWRIRDGIRNAGHLSGLFFRIARNKCIDIQRQKRRSPITLMDESLTETAWQEPEIDSYLAEIRYEVVMLVIAEEMELLPPQQKEVFRLYVKGIPLPQIADQMGVAQSTVRSHLTAAKKRIRKILKDNENYTHDIEIFKTDLERPRLE